MKKAITLFFCLAMLGCKKDSPATMKTIHVTVISQDNTEKILDVEGNVRETFKDKVFDKDFSVFSGYALRIMGAYRTDNTPTNTIHIIVKYNGAVIADQTAVQTVAISTTAP
jgi:hypothetical protein